MNIRKYVSVDSPEQALEILKGDDGSKIIAGGLFTRLHKKEITIGIDLDKLGLDYIRHEDSYHVIGSMTTLRDLEMDESLPRAIVESVLQIGGVAARNLATIGGSVMGNFAFSDINTALLALDAKLVFLEKGEVLIGDFIKTSRPRRDVLLEIKVPKVAFSGCKFMKLTYTDLSMVNAAAAVFSDGTIRLTVGARPDRAMVLESPDELKAEDFGSDFRGSAEYRQSVSKHYLMELLKEAKC